MSQQVVLRSLDELGEFAELFDDVRMPEEPRALMPVECPVSEEDLAETIRRAADELRLLLQEDVQARREAADALDQLRQLRENQAQLERLAGEAQEVIRAAATLADHGFVPESRDQAEQLGSMGRRMYAVIEARLVQLEAQAESLCSREDVARFLEEERRREEAQRREAEEREKVERLDDALAQAEALAGEQKFDEALRVLGDAGKLHPDSPALTSSVDNIKRRRWAVKTVQVEKALQAARRLLRTDAREAASQLEPLDLGDMPVELIRQTYGCWLQACRRLELPDAIHYCPSFGRGAVLASLPGGRLEVVSAIGMAGWKPGRQVSAAALKGCRPLH